MTIEDGKERCGPVGVGPGCGLGAVFGGDLNG